MGGLQILWFLVAIGWLICFVIVLIKMFQNEGALKGILGFICSLYALIWGWMNATKLGIKNIMLIWTVLWLLLFGLNFAGAGMYSMSGPTTP